MLYGFSQLAEYLVCQHCGRKNAAKQWPEAGDWVPFYFQKEPGAYFVTVHCYSCRKDWYVVWDQYPGAGCQTRSSETLGTGEAPRPAETESEVYWRCVACNGELKAPRVRAGKNAKCVHCGKVQLIPLAHQEVGTAAEAAPQPLLEVLAPSLAFKGASLLEQAIDRIHAHEHLGPLLCDLRAVPNEQAHHFFSNSFGLETGTEYSTPRELFRGVISLSSCRPDSSLRAWLVTLERLGQGPNVIFVLIDDSVTPFVLVCCKLASGGFWARYEDPTLVAQRLIKLAIAHGGRHEARNALVVIQLAVTIQDHLIGYAFAHASESQRMEFLDGLRIGYEVFLSLVLRYPNEVSDAVSALSDVILRRKMLGLEALATQRDLVLGGKYPELLPKLQRLNKLRSEMVRRSFEGTHDETLRQLKVEKEELEIELCKAIPELDLEKKLRVVDHAAVALALPKGSVLVEFIRFQCVSFSTPSDRGPDGTTWRYAAFVIPSEESDSVALVDLGDAERIDRLIAEFRSSVRGEWERDDTDRDMARTKAQRVTPSEDHAGQALSVAVIEPLVRAITGRKRLVIAPDGDLTRLPFEVLPTDDGRRLIDDYSISYVGCGRDILRFQGPSTGQAARALVAADPDFDLRRDGERQPSEGSVPGRHSRDLEQTNLSFDRLPATREEGNRIARLLKVRPWLQAEVLEQRLKQVRSPWILHLATHGFFLPDQRPDPGASSWTASSDMGRFTGLLLENPLLRSGLALAGGNTWLQNGHLPPEAEDGLLTAEDVTGMDLLDTELVVLSACNTGLGEIRTGEGVFGLRRAFVLAGAKTLVMSLWKVPDEETRELMEDFYRRILAGEPRAEALRNAQLTMKAKYPDPFFWGAFICQGNPGPLPPRRRWFFTLDGQEKQGPISDPELKGLIRSGKLNRTSMVSLDSKTWYQASHLKGVTWPGK